MALGSLWVIPMISMVKNMAMLAVVIVLFMVNIMPEATPLYFGGTEFMMDALFGEPNIPFPIPSINNTNPNSIYVKLYGIASNSRNADALIIIPVVAIHRAPNLSDNVPEIGLIINIPNVRGIM